MEIVCSTCGVNLISEDDFVRFECPNCGETEIIRCKKCRRVKNHYKCEKCGFVGP
ncbi:MAG: RNA-binding protein [Candidatus Aenigmatarchaeota archaeon]|nr:MAG: RNA-binding protein [Candidatus Aenigmarchaeota archaeon]